MERVKCPICGFDNYKVVLESADERYRLSKRKFILVQCNNCSLIYLNPRPSQKEIDKFYPEEYYDLRPDFLGERINQFFLRNEAVNIMKYKKSGRLLDLGCGAGDFLLEMKKRGFETFGLDVSKNACRIARKKSIKVINSELDNRIFPAHYFDIVTLWHVFEHLHSPVSVLIEIARILKKDGILLIEVPNISNFSFKLFKKYYFHLDIPRHLYHWSPQTLKMILNKNGFKIFQQETFSLSFPLSLFHSLFNFLRKTKMKIPIAWMIVFLFSPFLVILTLFSRSLPGRGEILRIYAVKNK